VWGSEKKGKKYTEKWHAIVACHVAEVQNTAVRHDCGSWGKWEVLPQPLCMIATFTNYIHAG
jgi:hypothetical protein